VSACELRADTSLSGEKVAAAVDKAVALRGAPESIAVDNGAEFARKAMDLWASTNGVHLGFIWPGRPVENGYIESFNGKLRDELLNASTALDRLMTKVLSAVRFRNWA